MANWWTNFWNPGRSDNNHEKRSTGVSYATTADDSILQMLGLSSISANATPQTAMGIATFFGCVRVISNLIASTPFGVYRELKTGGSKKDKEHSLDYILSIRANNQMSPFLLKKTVVANTIVWGFSVSRIVKDGSGKVESIYPYPSSNVTILEDTKTGLLFFQVIERGSRLILSQDEVIFIKDSSFDGNKGVSILKWQARTVKIDLLTQAFLEKYYEKGTFAAGFLEQTTIDVYNEEKMAAYKKAVLKSLKGAESGFGMAIIGAGGKWHPVTRSPVESQLMETFDKSASDIAMIFGVPLSILANTEKQTSWGTGVQQMFIGVTNIVLIPIAKQIEEEFNYKCFSRLETQKGRYTEFNFRALLRGDSTEFSNFIRTMLNLGVYNINEVRAFDNLPPIKGGERHYIQGAMVPLDKIDDIIDKKNTQKNGTGQTVHSSVN